jgi:hypothetical protein
MHISLANIDQFTLNPGARLWGPLKKGVARDYPTPFSQDEKNIKLILDVITDFCQVFKHSYYYLDHP